MALLNCNVCGGNALREFFRQESVPTSQTPVLPSKVCEEKVGALRMVACGDCTHIFNAAFHIGLDKELYSEDFAASLPTSPGYIKRYQEILQWIFKSDGPFKTVVEIGGGDFTFSKLLLEKGVEKIVVYEPSNAFKNNSAQIEHIQDYFSANTLPKTLPKVDLIVLRHILEHVVEPRSIIRSMAEILTPGAKIYIEVPNVGNILQEKRTYDFFYEHVNYFSVEVLSSLLREEGFEISRVQEWVGGQHFGILATRSSTTTKRIPVGAEIKLTKTTLLNEFQEYVLKFQEQYQEFFKTHPGTAIYGAGAHAITVINMLGLGPSHVPCLFDLNPHKNGRLSPVSHIPIHQPSIERLKKTSEIIVIAPLHQTEIHEQLRSTYAFKGRIFGTEPSLQQLS